MAEPLADHYDLRVFGTLNAREMIDDAAQGHYRHVRLTAQDAAKAEIVYSKILSDFTTLPTVKADKLADNSGLTVLSFEGGRRMLPVLHEDDKVVDVYLFESPDEMDHFVSSSAAALKGAELPAGRRHPFYLDFWDRHCMGFWYTLMRDKDFTDDRISPFSRNTNCR